MIELSLGGRGPKRAWVFDEHRFAYDCWKKALEGERPRSSEPREAASEGAASPTRKTPGGALLVSFDRHFDTVPFKGPELDPRNFDHIPAAVQAGILSQAVLIARARPPGAVTDGYVTAPTLDALLQQPEVLPLLERAETTLLDFDLDCFTTPSDADPTTAVPWPIELIREHVMPRGSERFWELTLRRCAGLTFAREPKHTGGLVASGRLFEAAAQVVFVELLQGDLP